MSGHCSCCSIEGLLTCVYSIHLYYNASLTCNYLCKHEWVCMIFKVIESVLWEAFLCTSNHVLFGLHHYDVIEIALIKTI